VTSRFFARWRDAALAVVLCTLGCVELLAPARYDGSPVWPGPVGANLALVAVLTLPLALRGRWPTVVPVIVLAAAAAGSLALGGAEATTEFVVFIVCSYTLAAHGRRVVLCLVVLTGTAAIHEVRDPHVHGVGDVVWAFGLPLAAWLLGLAVRLRQQRIGQLESDAESAERRHAEEVAAATAAERASIARELHDIVSHLVAVIVIQAQAGSRALPHDAATAADVLRTIESSGRTALGELRQLLTVLAGEPEAATEPRASLRRLPELLEEVRRSGLDVEVHGAAPTDLPVLVDVAAFRIVQEALTNVLRHAVGASARVGLEAGSKDLVVTVEDLGASTPTSTPGAGRGLIGMRERAALAGGSVTARAEDTGFVVRAVLPLAETAPA
jgi:signal transduction histidine kinase